MAYMTGIKDLPALVGAFCRPHSWKPKMQISPIHKKLKQYVSKSNQYFKPLDFTIIGLSGIFVLLILICPGSVLSANEKSLAEEDEILEMDIHQLMQTEVIVTSVSKRPEPLHKTASAIYVLTEEDIRRSGAVNIMEALRMVPGVLVSKLNQNRYAISIRGFNQRLGSDKLLVLMDGRSIYSPVQSGVFWIGQDTVLEDIERIEVIRGPGAALWGSNAVAGVINIITKNAGDTQGGLVAGGVGTEENGFGTMRYGGKTEKGLNYRVYGKYRDRDEGKIPNNGGDSFDSKQMGQGGFRTDWESSSKKDKFTAQGDYYRLNSDLDFTSRFVSLAPPFGIDGSTPFQGTNVQEGINFLTRWNRTLEDSSSFHLQMYYDRLKRKSGVPFDNVVDQYDIDFQHNFSFAKVHNFSWGLNYRYTYFDLETTSIIQNSKDDSHLASLFLHDEIALIPEELSLILGSKFEYNVFTGLEIQPNARVAWNPHPNHTLWASFSRAVRLPTVTDENITVNRIIIPFAGGGDCQPGPPVIPCPLLIKQTPNSGMKPEELLAYELGYRLKASEKVNFDVTAYYFDYDNLIALNDGTFTPGPVSVLQVFNDNSAEGEVYGVELSGQWQVLRNWRLSGSYTFVDIQLHTFPGAIIDGSALNTDGDLEAEGEPNHIFNIRSYLNLPYNLELDTFFYYVSDNTSRSIPEYGRLDVRLGWKPVKNVDLSFVAQNLLDETHPELNELLEVSSETQRSYFLKATLNF
jgi:iron complex outermembrane recepter protein